MSRVIKFRAFSNGKMGETFDPFDSQFLASGGTFDRDAIFMQFAGMLDRDAIEIYEGDVVIRRNRSSTDLSDNKPKIGVVKYSINRAKFYIEFTDRRCADLDATMGNETGTFDERLKIIGNIYQPLKN